MYRFNEWLQRFAAAILSFVLALALIWAGQEQQASGHARAAKSLDGGYYLLDEEGNLSFRFIEEYSPDPDAPELKYSIFNQFNVLVSQPAPKLLVRHGDNRYTLNMLCEGVGLGDAGFYVLEIRNLKGEKWYLRFRIEKEVECPADPSR